MRIGTYRVIVHAGPTDLSFDVRATDETDARLAALEYFHEDHPGQYDTSTDVEFSHF